MKPVHKAFDDKLRLEIQSLDRLDDARVQIFFAVAHTGDVVKGSPFGDGLDGVGHLEDRHKERENNIKDRAREQEQHHRLQ